MINWIKKEYQAFCNSRTIKLAYAKKLGGLISLILVNLGYFENAVSPEQFGMLLIILGFADNQLRKLTSKAL